MFPDQVRQEEWNLACTDAINPACLQGLIYQLPDPIVTLSLPHYIKWLKACISLWENTLIIFKYGTRTALTLALYLSMKLEVLLLSFIAVHKE